MERIPKLRAQKVDPGEDNSPGLLLGLEREIFGLELLEYIICKHFSHLEQNIILTNLNHRFRSAFTCQTQLVTTLQALREVCLWETHGYFQLFHVPCVAAWALPCLALAG